MSLLDEHLVPRERVMWTVPDDPTDEVPIWWSGDQRDQAQSDRALAFPP